LLFVVSVSGLISWEDELVAKGPCCWGVRLLVLFELGLLCRKFMFSGGDRRFRAVGTRERTLFSVLVFSGGFGNVVGAVGCNSCKSSLEVFNEQAIGPHSQASALASLAEGDADWGF